jgi:hypothetical protein
MPFGEEVRAVEWQCVCVCVCTLNIKGCAGMVAVVVVVRVVGLQYVLKKIKI